MYNKSRLSKYQDLRQRVSTNSETADVSSDRLSDYASRIEQMTSQKAVDSLNFRTESDYMPNRSRLNDTASFSHGAIDGASQARSDSPAGVAAASPEPDYDRMVKEQEEFLKSIDSQYPARQNAILKPADNQYRGFRRGNMTAANATGAQTAQADRGDDYTRSYQAGTARPMGTSAQNFDQTPRYAAFNQQQGMPVVNQYQQSSYDDRTLQNHFQQAAQPQYQPQPAPQQYGSVQKSYNGFNQPQSMPVGNDYQQAANPPFGMTGSYGKIPTEQYQPQAAPVQNQGYQQFSQQPAMPDAAWNQPQPVYQQPVAAPIQAQPVAPQPVYQQYVSAPVAGQPVMQQPVAAPIINQQPVFNSTQPQMQSSMPLQALSQNQPQSFNQQPAPNQVPTQPMMSQAIVAPAQPQTAAAQPTIATAQPQPIVNQAQPQAASTQPVVATAQPQPIVSQPQPQAAATQPVVAATQPQPIISLIQPQAAAAQPTVVQAQPQQVNSLSSHQDDVFKVVENVNPQDTSNKQLQPVGSASAIIAGQYSSQPENVIESVSVVKAEAANAEQAVSPVDVPVIKPEAPAMMSSYQQAMGGMNVQIVGQPVKEKVKPAVAPAVDALVEGVLGAPIAETMSPSIESVFVKPQPAVEVKRQAAPSVAKPSVEVPESEAADVSEIIAGVVAPVVSASVKPTAKVVKPTMDSLASNEAIPAHNEETVPLARPIEEEQPSFDVDAQPVDETTRNEKADAGTVAKQAHDENIELDDMQKIFDQSNAEDSNEYIDKIIQDVKDHNIQTGIRSEEDTTANIFDAMGINYEGAKAAAKTAPAAAVGEKGSEFFSIDDADATNEQPSANYTADDISNELSKMFGAESSEPDVSIDSIKPDDAEVPEPEAQPAQTKAEPEPQPQLQKIDDAVPEVDSLTGTHKIVFDDETSDPSDINHLNQKIENERALRQDMIEQTKQLKLRVSEYENEVSDMNSSMSRTNHVLNFVLTLLIITLFVILFIIAYWFAQERGLI